MSPDPSRIASGRVPSSRIERLARVGWLGVELTAGGVGESLRRWRRGESHEGSSLFTAANADRLVRRLSRLRGAAMKAGQLLSMEARDLLPPEVADRLAALRGDGEAMPPAQVEQVLTEEIGTDWRRRFREFDLEPMAAASIGQVHAAVAAPGAELAVKIQFPGIAESVDSDVANLASAVRLARILPPEFDLDPIVAETRRRLREETDYRREAASLRRYRELLSDEPELVVPQVWAPLSGTRVLAMQRLRGVPLEDLCGPDHDDATRDRVGALLIRLLLRELMELRFVQTDPNFANYLWLPDGRVGLLDLGAVQDLPAELSRSYADLLRGALCDDRAQLWWAARELGFVDDADPPETVDGLLDLIVLSTEPFRIGGAYDFGRSDLPARAREASLRFVSRGHVRRAPPARTLFLQRKLGGTFLLCHRLRARVPVRDMLRAALERIDAPPQPVAAPVS